LRARHGFVALPFGPVGRRQGGFDGIQQSLGRAKQAQSPQRLFFGRGQTWMKSVIRRTSGNWRDS
jgi:hypothetical protein